MTPEQKIIAIAEWEGWKVEQDCHPGAKFVFYKPGGGKWLADYIDGQLPPYLTSRDAICGAVARLPDWDDDGGKDKAEYSERLAYVVGANWSSNNVEDRRRIMLATPSQLADALLLTLGHKI